MKRPERHKQRLQHALRRMLKAAGITQTTGTSVALARLLNPAIGTKSEMYAWLAKVSNEGMPSPSHRREPGPSIPPAPRRNSAEFYASDDWRRLRFRALKASNGACSLCGRSNRLHGVILHVDHIKPRSRYPALELQFSNLQVLCEDCNLGKGNRDDTDWRAPTAEDANVIALDKFDWRSF